MSEFKGTKGKWVVEKQSKNSSFYYINNDNLEIGEIATCYSVMENGYNQSFANAKLIACAPEMLEMLKNVKEYLENITGKHLSKPLANEIEQLIKKVTS